MPSSTLGARLRTARRYLDMNQITFAEEMGCTQSFISHIEHNRSGPSAPLLAALEGRGISGSWLLTGKLPMLRATSDPSAPSAPSDSLARDAPSSSPQSSILIPLSSGDDVQAGDVIVVRLDRRDHPLALIGKIIYTLPRK